MRAASIANVGIKMRRLLSEEVVALLFMSSIPAAAMRELIRLASLE
jgi:hypothetical protein